jgi:hypothetical protein
MAVSNSLTDIRDMIDATKTPEGNLNYDNAEETECALIRISERLCAAIFIAKRGAGTNRRSLGSATSGAA